MNLAQMIAKQLENSGQSAQAGAKAAGVSYASFMDALHGKSKPNAKTIEKWARWLGVTAQDVRAATTAHRKTKPSATSGPLHSVVQMLANAEALLNDQLAQQVHTLNPEARKTLQAVINAMR